MKGLRVVLASNNAGKLRELRALLAPAGVDLVSQGELGVSAAEEPHATFLENALAKARHAAAATGLAAIGDDSGLCCAALGGQPGVRSARYAGEGASDEQNNRALILRLAGVADRRAHFTCVLVAVRGADDPEPVVADARWHGTIVDEPRGAQGFGYDPHFLVAGLDRTASQLGASEKNRLSHRGQAMQRLLEGLTRNWMA